MMADGSFEELAARDAAHRVSTGAFKVGDEYKIKGTQLFCTLTHVDVKGTATVRLASGEVRQMAFGDLETAYRLEFYTDANGYAVPRKVLNSQPRLIVPEPKRASVFLRASDLAGKPVPDRHYLVPDLIPGRTVTLLGGDGGTGKSLLATQLAVAVATGGHWIGHSTATGPVVFISAEDELDELHRRLADIVAQQGCTLADLDRLTIRSLAGEDALLATLDGQGKALAPSRLCEEVEALLNAEQPALLVLDTLADLFPGNENDRAQARQFVGILKGLAIRHDCAIVLLSHPSLSGLNSGSGTSGSTGWNNSVRSRLYLERIKGADGKEDNPDARVLRTMKANYGPTGGEISMTWRNGVFVMDAQESGLDRAAKNAKAERLFLSLVRLYAEQGRPVNPERAAAEFEKDPDADGFRKQAFQKAKDVLLKSGKVKIVVSGPPSRPRKHLEVAS